MDEENSKIKQAIEKGIKKQKEKSARKVVKNLIAFIAPILLKAVIIAVLVGIIFTALSNIVDKIKGETSKDANAFAVDYSSRITDESSDNRIIADIGNISANGAYNLTYEFKDDEGNILTENEAIQKIKADLLKENSEFDLAKFSNSELKVIGALMYNGLLVDSYTEEELKALVMFVKADIASQSFDLRSSEETISVEDLENNDIVYGTIQIHRTKLEDDGNGGVVSNEVKLKYIPYGNDTTPNTFCYLVAQNDESVIDTFSINEDDELVIAKWNETSTTYQYLSSDQKELSADEKAQIATENLGEDTPSETCITEATPINYKQYITEFIANYGLLSDLLIATQNVDFCLELAELAFNSKIVINVKEELTITTTTETTNYTQTKLIYDYVKYEVSGQQENTATTSEEIADGKGKNEVLWGKYGWESDLSYTVTGEGGGTWVYTWTNEELGNTYKLDYCYVSNSWKLYIVKETTVSTALTKKTNENEEGDLINVDNNHIKEEYDYYTIDEDYTDEEVFEYTIVRTTQTKTNSCSVEISEIDTWYAKYTSQYNTPSVTLNSSSGEINSNKGEYSIELEQVSNTTNLTEINADSHVSEFITQMEESYKSEYSRAENIQCNVTELTVKQRVKTDIQGGEYTSEKTKYEFGENAASTTQIEYKNVEYINNERSFTEEGEDGNPEIGFLYIYNKYIENGVDLFLQDDAEQQLFELLESDTETVAASEIIKTLLFVYDGIDRGGTNFTFSITDINSFNIVRGSSTENYIKAWENSPLWNYETGRSSVFPSLYLTEDEENYIVYEDASWGHNNISYGITTFITCSENKPQAVYREDFGCWGYYNWESDFTQAGISIRDLYDGAYVDKEIADSVFQNSVVPYFVGWVDNYLKTNLPDYEFSQEQKDALIAVCYNSGNINGFANAYINSLNEDGTLDAEKLRHNYTPFNYTGTSGDRRYANWLLFTEGTYLDRSGNEIVMRTILNDWDGEVYSNDNYTFPVYNQYDSRWTTYPYGGPRGNATSSYSQRTIGSSGCGCCALAAILSGYLGEVISPDILTQKLDEVFPSGSYYKSPPNGGSIASVLCSNGFLKEYGCSSKYESSREEALEALKSGYAVFGGENGHYLAFVPVSSEDAAQGYVFRIIDSALGHNYLCKDFSDADKIVSNGGIEDDHATVSYIIYPYAD